MWRRHVIVLSILAAMVVPIGLIDRALLAPGGGGWISLDFRGLLVGAYVIWLLIQALLTTAVVSLRKPERLLGVHLRGAVVSAAVFAGGWLVYFFVSDIMRAADARKSEEAALAFSKVLTLEGWSVAGSPEPQQVLARVLSDGAGDFAMNVGGDTAGGMTVLTGEVGRRPVAEGARLDLRIPLKRWGPGDVTSWHVHLVFFRRPARYPDALPDAWDSIGTTYESGEPRKVYDGIFVYRRLPPPSPSD